MAKRSSLQIRFQAQAMKDRIRWKLRRDCSVVRRGSMNKSEEPS